MHFRPEVLVEDHIRFENDRLILLDQRALPLSREYIACENAAEAIEAIRNMTVRGAPAIGIAGAYACVLAAQGLIEKYGPEAEEALWGAELENTLASISRTRPTAVNLAWAVERMRSCRPPSLSLALVKNAWTDEAASIHLEDIAANKKLGVYGAELVADGDSIMTHCNAGALATGGFGTALGVIRAAHGQGKAVRVIANETRPWLQGARLTSYELQADGIPVTLACDNAAALLMAKGLVDMVITGADRIAANGDSANKIGTYGLAVLAKAHKIPFYIAAPLSTIDPQTPDGSLIPIEERPFEEVTTLAGRQISPPGLPAFNFSFDVTPAELIAGIITEKGVLRPAYGASIKKAFGTECSF